jgi:Kelch motif
VIKRTLQELAATRAGQRCVTRGRLYRARWEARQKPGALAWRIVAPCPDPKLDAGGVQIGSRLYVIAGYSSRDTVSPYVDVLDLARRQWVERISLAPGVAHSHLAFASDRERFIYIVSGQYGPQCAPAVRDGFVLDLAKRAWGSLPALPEPRYAATMQFWRGRLHVMGGSLADRYTASSDHWSIAVAGGEATEAAWRREPPIPRPVCHHASAVVGDCLYLLGGQAGDFMAIPGSPTYECTGRTRETYHRDVFRLRPKESAWERLPDMPLSASHTEAAVLLLGSTIVVVGGQCLKNPETFNLELTDAIQALDTGSGQWTIIGRLPYRVKTVVAGYHRGWMYAVGGQRDRGTTRPDPGNIVSYAWRAPLRIP